MLMTLAMLVSLIPAVTMPAKAITFGTADGTYDFGSLEADVVDGHKTLGDKFKVSSAFIQNGTRIFPNDAPNVNTQGASVDLVIKAEGTTVNKKFTFKDMNLSTEPGGENDNILDIFTITFINASGTTIAQHILQSNVQVPDTGINISQFPFTQPFPANGYDNVSEIRMTCSYVTNYFCWLEFNTITIANVTATLSTAPTLISSAYDASSGLFVVSGSGMTGGDTIDVSKLMVTGEGGINYTLTSGNVPADSKTQFSVTLNTVDKATINQILNKNGTSSTGGTTYNLAAADGWDTSAEGDTADTENPITVSNVAVPTITSAAYNASTGELTVTGTGFLIRSESNNDIIANKFTVTGDNGAKHILSSTLNVDISSGTSFTITLSAVDKAAVNQILNRNGTSSKSGTTYNLEAAEDWAAGADPSVAVADMVNNGITVGNVMPKVTDANISINSGTGTSGAFKIGDTVTATWNNTADGDNNSDITSVTFNFSQFGGGNAVAATESAGTWTAAYTIVAGVIDGTNRNVSVTAADNAGNSTTTTDTTNVTVDNIAPSVTDGNISISGGTGTGGAYKIGDTATATWNNTAGGDNNSDTISGGNR